ncbi:energy transducer TonB [Colwellia psychrerythraea]|uniref:TonB family protein n=1 Tax=Colwellia psychrerythraea TaxID=28229 RepID=A0A099KHA4_COLPS|nr:energy transducer TonB [Colwellia psychrerythraea]KGJ90169.1 TonB family protein [Colwellia psychrerythraea]
MNKFVMISAFALMSLSISSLAKTIYADVQVTDIIPTSHTIWQRENQNTPKYPIKLARSGIRGCAVLAFNISAMGKTENIEVINSLPKKSIAKSARKMLKKWHWVPVSSQQKPRLEKRTIRLDFCLGGKSIEQSQQYCLQQTKLACS